MTPHALIPHLFRTEFSKITAVLCKHFGIAYMEMAEDMASETFVTALETWPRQGIPENPTAWLYAVAKNKARNYISRHAHFTREVSRQLKDASTGIQEVEIDLSDTNIKDSQLQMLFVIGHPALSAEAQIALSLRILCGFGIDEIADAFLTSKETINKRLYRAREKLRNEQVKLLVPPESEINKRLDTVLTTLYLLFNEGYYSESQASVLRKELCLEAMRLNYLLIENERTNLPPVNALLALMCFHASRFEARKNDRGEMILYHDQDETLWNEALIAKGVYFFHQASQGNSLSKYHLEAGIAYWHTKKEDTEEKWKHILQLYDHLLQTAYSPIAALNRTFALSKVKGKTVAIAEAERLDLDDNHYYFTLLGELYSDIDKAKAKVNFQKALTLAKTSTDRETIQRKMERLSLTPNL
ncbi:RNA polymerase sigma factor [Catalinimonas niigatensis]|uniref:RNA polymerase sigma factor n=1 Tax=Catalinimonas niigatensis TaxID=1397264 RepID=UPI0026661543|nr:sigma-70 family RNA polymerase sigma factor [Catalinimonas niigatensis]WPP52794.1 sigma-70 family RNA polymerase sigma factor [Catalinimonas niigatensis]